VIGMINPIAIRESSGHGVGILHIAEITTLTEWSTEDVNIRHSGNRPTPHTRSVTGRVWSESKQYGVMCSFCVSSSINLDSFSMRAGCDTQARHTDLDIDQTFTLESSLPETKAEPSFVKRSTLTWR
jgi:hypothetical protein